MKHFAAPAFWKAFAVLEPETQQRARASFELLQRDPRHPSLRLKKAGRFWSAQVGRVHRAIAVESEDGLVWIWIGEHDPYERKLG